MPAGRSSMYIVQRAWRPGGLVRLHSGGGAHQRRPWAAHGDSEQRTWAGGHRIDLRASVPLPGGRWYVTILAGPERRGPERLKAEGQTHWLRRAAVYVMLMSLALWLVVCALALVYLLKSAAGIHLMEANSPLHFMWEWLE